MSTETTKKPLFTKQEFDSNISLMLSEYMEEDETSELYDPELVEPRKAFIGQLTPDQITNVEVVSIYEDDHEACVDAHITFTSGDVLSLTAPWIIPEFVACFIRGKDWNSRKEIIEYLQGDLFSQEELNELPNQQKPDDGKTPDQLVEVLMDHYAGMEHSVILDLVQEYLATMSEGELRSRITGEGLDVNGNDISIQLPIQDYVFNQQEMEKSSPREAIVELFENQTIVSIDFNEDFTNYEGNVEYDANITFDNGSVLHAIGYHGMWEMTTFNCVIKSVQKDFQDNYLENILWYYDN